MSIEKRQSNLGEESVTIIGVCMSLPFSANDAISYFFFLLFFFLSLSIRLSLYSAAFVFIFFLYSHFGYSRLVNDAYMVAYVQRLGYYI